MSDLTPLHSLETEHLRLPDFRKHAAVQAIAKAVLADLGPTLTAADSEYSIAARAVRMLAAHGVTETWYYECPAFVLLGSRSCLSVSGRNYVPSREPVGERNVISVDLSPLLENAWGDCARTFIVEHGAYAPAPTTHEFKQGLEAESRLHQALVSFATPTATFGELATFGNSELRRLGFENLDFQANLGHSIEAHRDDRTYIEPGVSTLLGSVAFFAFEPHIRKIGGTWGFKHEDIYYFDSEQRPQAL